MARARALLLAGLVCLLLGFSALTGSAATLNVPAGGDLQAAIDAALPGDVILLESGATFVGTFRLPRKPGETYITIRTAPSAPNLPPPFTRVTPAQAAGFAKLQAPNAASPALVTAEGAHHWRIELLEIVGVGGGDLVLLGASGSQTQISQMPYELVFDRVYIHGDPVLGQKRGITANSGKTHIVNSHISDIKAIGIDSQAICGWNGTGPFLIENNYLEAAGENVMFGGADPSIWNLVPSDITLRRNLLTKPLSWRGERWSVKNAFELKNARRVLVEGNVIEHVWQASQTGFAVLLTPRNQGGKAPWSVVEDVTIRYNVIRHAGGAFNITGYDDERPSAQGGRIQISHNLVYDIDAAAWGGSGRFVQIGNQPRDIVIEQNTVLQSGSVLTAYGKPIGGLVFRHNLARHGKYGVVGDGQAPGHATLQAYFPGAQFERNVLAGGRPADYPPGNLFPTVAEYESAFANMAGGDFTLAPGSSFRTAASDGGALGADLNALSEVARTAPATMPGPAYGAAGGANGGGSPVRWPSCSPRTGACAALR